MQHNRTDIKTVVHNGQTVNSWVHEGEVVYTSQHFTVTFKGGNGEVLKTESVPYGLSATPPEVDGYHEVEGYLYEIIGWDGDYTKVTQDITVSIKTSNVKMHTIVFVDWDENEISRCIVPYGDYSAIVTPENPEREGYTFSGWAMGAYNQPVVTWTATYEAKTYTIYFRVSALQEDSYATHYLRYKVGYLDYTYHTLSLDDFDLNYATFSIEAKAGQEIVFTAYYNDDGVYAKSFNEDTFEVKPFSGTDPDDPLDLYWHDVSEAYTMRFKFNALDGLTDHYETVSYSVAGEYSPVYTFDETVYVGHDGDPNVSFSVTAFEGAQITILSIKSTAGATATPLESATYVVTSSAASTVHTIGYEKNDTCTLHFRCWALDNSYEGFQYIRYRLNDPTGESPLTTITKFFEFGVDKDNGGYTDSTIEFSITAGRYSVVEFVSIDTSTGLSGTFSDYPIEFVSDNTADNPYDLSTVRNTTKYKTRYHFTATKTGQYYLKYHIAIPNTGVSCNEYWCEASELTTIKTNVTNLVGDNYFNIEAEYGSRIHIVQFYYGIAETPLSFANTPNPILVNKNQSLNLE